MLQRTDFQQTDPQLLPARRSVAVVLIVTTALAICALFVVSFTYFKSLDREAAQTRLLLYQRSLSDTLERFQHLPFVLARDPVVVGAHEAPSMDVLNRRLAAFATQAELEAIYLMDTSGLAVASSNYDQQHSFVGQNYGFRPYFKQALLGERGNYFGVGATTGRPGYFVSEPVRDPSDGVVGVIAIKLDVSELQQTWERGGENVLVSNTDGIVVLASNADWLYRTLKELSAEQADLIGQSKQFGDKQLNELEWSQSGASVQLDDRTYTYAAGQADHLGWRVHYLLSEGRAYERALLATIIFGSAISLLVGFATYLRSKRIQAALLASQSDRDQLRQANQQLELAHSELARSSKLAALGQLSASVVHELGQPISAFRNYLTAEELKGRAADGSMVAKLSSVLNRMENITKQLRFFTKPGDPKIEHVALTDVLAGGLELMQHDLERAGIDARQIVETPDIEVMGNRLRLEQVLVNLLRNSLSSLEEASADDLELKISKTSNEAVISVSDNGVGFGERDLSQLQEPFHTTRASGDGMGLGLSITAEIVKEHGGRLEAKNLDGGGALFSVYLPLALPKERTV